MVPTGSKHGGKAGGPCLLAELPPVEPHVLAPLLAHPPHDRLGHHIARRQVGELVLALQEAHPVVVDEECTFAADGFGHERLLPP